MDKPNGTAAPGRDGAGQAEYIALADVGLALRRQAWRIAGIGILSAALVYGGTLLLPDRYTAQATLLPARQQQAATALSSLGVLAGAVGSVVAHTGEQYVAFLSSRTVSERIVSRFGLASGDSADAREQALRDLARRAHFEVNRRDNLLSISVTDRDARRAAAMANAYVDELRRLTQQLFGTAIAERRAAIERELQASAAQLAQAQRGLQGSRFAEADLRLDGRSAGTRYSQLQAQLATAQVRLAQQQARLQPGAPELTQAQSAVAALTQQLALASQPLPGAATADHAGKLRDYRQREQLHQELARQLDQLRLEESRGAPAIPVLDAAEVPQRPSAPRRLRTALLSGVAAAIVASMVLLLRGLWRARPGTPG